MLPQLQHKIYIFKNIKFNYSLLNLIFILSKILRNCLISY